MIHHGDCLEVMATMPDASVDAVVCDPPAGISFMNKSWDHHLGGRDAWVAWMTEVMTECYRLLKPGGHILVWALPRTSHWTGWAIESAGFEMRDKLIHCFASGFPKSLDVSKAIDKAAGAEREVVKGAGRSNVGTGRQGRGDSIYSQVLIDGSNERTVKNDLSLPATDAARKWAGFGTALKPAYEDWWLARKPLRGTVAANVQEYGTGAINIDGCRIGGDGGTHSESSGGQQGVTYAQGALAGDYGMTVPGLGRWPANVLLTVDDDGRAIFDGGVEGVVGGGETSSGALDRSKITAPNLTYGARPHTLVGRYESDTGTYSRFFILPKAARSDREPVVRGTLEERDVSERNQYATLPDKRMDHTQNRTARANSHPTVKPVELMRHLVRLVTPPGGTVLDPFLGSGTTAIAAEQEGFAWIGIEKEAEYVAIAEARLNGTQRGLGLDVPAPTRKRDHSKDGAIGGNGRGSHYDRLGNTKPGVRFRENPREAT